MDRKALKVNKSQLVLKQLRILHPDARCELNYTTPLELLIATILSAQCTDVRVNIVTKELFKTCRKAEDFLKLSTAELEQIIKSTGFFRSKAKSIRGAVEQITAHHKGQVPSTMEELVELPGVGRKTANVVLGNAFGIPGLPVDTHVKRLANRLGLSNEEAPVKLELYLNSQLASKDWTIFSHTLIFHGRRVCKARNPACQVCPVASLCNYFKETQNDN